MQVSWNVTYEASRVSLSQSRDASRRSSKADRRAWPAEMRHMRRAPSFLERSWVSCRQSKLPGLSVRAATEMVWCNLNRAQNPPSRSRRRVTSCLVLSRTTRQDKRGASMDQTSKGDEALCAETFTAAFARTPRGSPSTLHYCIQYGT